jgi:hypothetical protein
MTIFSPDPPPASISVSCPSDINDSDITSEKFKQFLITVNGSQNPLAKKYYKEVYNIMNGTIDDPIPPNISLFPTTFVFNFPFTLPTKTDLTTPHVTAEAIFQFTMWLIRRKILNEPTYSDTKLYQYIKTYLQDKGVYSLFSSKPVIDSILVKPDSPKTSLLWKLNELSTPISIDVIDGLDYIVAKYLQNSYRYMIDKLGIVSDSHGIKIGAVGNGGNTYGILNILGNGILFFNYDYYTVRDNIRVSQFYKNIEVPIDGTDSYIKLFSIGQDWSASTILKITIDKLSVPLYLINGEMDSGSSIKRNKFYPIKRIKLFILDFIGIGVKHRNFENRLNTYLGDRITGRETDWISKVNEKFMIDDVGEYDWNDDSLGNIGTYSFEDGILRFNPTLEIKKVQIDILGKYNNSEVDEVAVFIYSVPKIDKKKKQIIPQLFAHLKFDDNQFAANPILWELPPVADLNLLADEIKKAILKFDISISLTAKGIGNVIDPKPSKTTRNYKDENQNDRTAAEAGMTPLNFAERRYSYAKIFMWPSTQGGTLEIVIEGFVSPLRCTWDTLGFPGKQQGFDDIIYPMRLEEGGKVIYNHVLSGLRTFGTLEIILAHIRATVQTKLTVSEFSIFENKVNATLSTLKVTIFDKHGNYCGDITYDDYVNKIKP